MENYLPRFCRNDRGRWRSEAESKESTKVLRRRDHVLPLLQPQGRDGGGSLRLLPLHPLKFQDRYTGFPLMHFKAPFGLWISQDIMK